MDSPVKLLQNIKKRVQSVTYGSPIYRLMLDQGPVPEAIRLVITDPWPGDAKRGQALIAAQPGLFGGEDFLEDVRSYKAFLSHEWLRDLRAVGTDLARRKAVALINEWIDDQDVWNEESWAPDVLGARLANWISFYAFYGSSASESCAERQRVSMVRQLRHLLHTAPARMVGLDGLNVIKGLVYGGLGLLDGEKALGLALELLARQLDEEILSDGGVIFRSPRRQVDMLRALIDIRAAFQAGQIEVPQSLLLAIAQMAPVLKFFRHGDGGLAVFHGGDEGEPLLLDAILTIAEVRGRLLKRLPQMGYERVAAGRSLLLVDVGAPPPRGFDLEAHAGLASFEFSMGRERIIVNCGLGPQGSDPAWRLAMAATAAHSTITLGNTNACELLSDGGIGARPRHLETGRYEQDGTQYVEIGHDGYAPRHRAGLQRVLGLSKDGDFLLGREMISGPSGKEFTIRFHLHPAVTALLVQGGGAALLRTASGAGWRFRVMNKDIELALEASVYCGQGRARRTLQLRVSGRTRQEQTSVEWALTREKIAKGS